MDYIEVIAANGVPYRIVLTDLRGPCASARCASWQSDPIVEFYDLRFAPERGGQFTGGRYYARTLLEAGAGGLDLCMHVHSWKVDSATMQDVRTWLRAELAVRDTRLP